jgi:hypothetical protein
MERMTSKRKQLQISRRRQFSRRLLSRRHRRHPRIWLRMHFHIPHHHRRPGRTPGFDDFPRGTPLGEGRIGDATEASDVGGAAGGDHMDFEHMDMVCLGAGTEG